MHQIHLDNDTSLSYSILQTQKGPVQWQRQLRHGWTIYSSRVRIRRVVSLYSLILAHSVFCQRPRKWSPALCKHSISMLQCCKLGKPPDQNKVILELMWVLCVHIFKSVRLFQMSRLLHANNINVQLLNILISPMRNIWSMWARDMRSPVEYLEYVCKPRILFHFRSTILTKKTWWVA